MPKTEPTPPQTLLQTILLRVVKLEEVLLSVLLTVMSRKI